MSLQPHPLTSRFLDTFNILISKNSLPFPVYTCFFFPLTVAYFDDRRYEEVIADDCQQEEGIACDDEVNDDEAMLALIAS